jgi:hypothetical protein
MEQLNEVKQPGEIEQPVEVEQQDEVKQPSAFKLEWEAKKLLKRSKKKAKKQLVHRGHTPSEATGMIKQAFKSIANNKPEKRAAGRGK